MGAKAMSKHDIFLAKIGSKINAVARDGSIVPAPVFQTHSTTSPTTFSYTQHTYYPHHPDQASSSPKRVPLELLSPRQHVLALPDPSKNSSSSDQNHIQGTFAPDVTSSPYAVSLQRPRPRIGAKPGGAGGKKHHPLNTHQPRLRSSNIECPAIRAVVTKLGVLIDVPEKGSKDKGIVAGGVSTVRFGRASQMGVREGENGHGDALTEAFPKMFGQSALDGSRIKEQQERGGMEVGNGERTVHVGDESGLGLKIGEQIRTDSGVDLTPVENLQMRDVAGEEALAVPTILVSPPHAPPHHELGETTTGAEKKAEDASIQEPVEETPEQIAAKIMDRIQRCKSWDVPTLRELTGMFALLEDRKEEQKGTDGTAPASSSKVAESTKNTRGGGRIRNKREQNGTIYVNPEFGLRLQDFDCMPNYSDTAGLGYARAATTSQVPMFSGESAHHPSSSDDVFHRSTWPTAHHFAADMVAPSLLNHSTSVQHAIAKHRAQIQDVSAGGAGFGVNGNGGFGMGRTSMVQMVTRKAGKHHHHHHHHHHSLPSIAQPRNPNNNQPAQNTTDPTSDNLFFTTISSPSPWAIQGVSAETPFLTSTNGAQQESFFPLVEQSLYDYLPVTTNISLDTQQQGNRNKGGTGAMSNAVVVANPPVAVLASSTTSMGTVPHLPVLNNNGHHQHTVQVEAITAGVQAQLKNGEHTAQLPVPSANGRSSVAIGNIFASTDENGFTNEYVCDISTVAVIAAWE
ncbi:hypothetical protein HK102_001524 [Quaeritorhiza haematococci]|nr:hypothetical protein HK102_001524 [Quaeritorhiza haematococci]